MRDVIRSLDQLIEYVEANEHDLPAAPAVECLEGVLRFLTDPQTCGVVRLEWLLQADDTAGALDLLRNSGSSLARPAAVVGAW